MELGLHVDEVRIGGGNSNDGNTARRFFREAERSAEITKLDVSLIKRCGTILQVGFSFPNFWQLLLLFFYEINYYIYLSTGAVVRIPNPSGKVS